jgi:hypothetical protein
MKLFATTIILALAAGITALPTPGDLESQKGKDKHRQDHHDSYTAWDGHDERVSIARNLFSHRHCASTEHFGSNAILKEP